MYVLIVYLRLISKLNKNINYSNINALFKKELTNIHDTINFYQIL